MIDLHSEQCSACPLPSVNRTLLGTILAWHSGHFTAFGFFDRIKADGGDRTHKPPSYQDGVLPLNYVSIGQFIHVSSRGTWSTLLTVVRNWPARHYCARVTDPHIAFGSEIPRDLLPAKARITLLYAVQAYFSCNSFLFKNVHRLWFRLFGRLHQMLRVIRLQFKR